jgi:hypothetical protein
MVKGWSKEGLPLGHQPHLGWISKARFDVQGPRVMYLQDFLFVR